MIGFEPIKTKNNDSCANNPCTHYLKYATIGRNQKLLPKREVKLSKRKKMTEPDVNTPRLYMCQISEKPDVKDYLKEHRINHITRNGTIYIAVNGDDALAGIRERFGPITVR